MDGARFDELSRSLATRRSFLARISAGGAISAALAGLGISTGKILAQDEAPTCMLDLIATVRLGPHLNETIGGDKNGELRGQLLFDIGDNGRLVDAKLRLPDLTDLPAVGQVAGPSITVRVSMPDSGVLVLVGAGEKALRSCDGAVDGLLTGPSAGDLGDWHALATKIADGGQPSNGAANTATTESGGADPNATAAASSTATSVGPAPTATANPCPSGQSFCGGVCIDTMYDQNNCGACGAVCTGLCDSGRCACNQDLTFCPTGCANLLTSNQNCGACGNVCPGATTCQNGQCRCPGFVQPCAGGYCPDFSSDQNNCGICNFTCENGQTCQNGSCVCDPYGSTPYYCPGVGCVDLASDPAHCGNCANTCPAGWTCCTGASGTECQDLRSGDPYCGACFTFCRFDLVCQNGQCVEP